MKLTVCDSCSKGDVKDGDYCKCDGADFVSGWLQSFEYTSETPAGRLPDDVEVDAGEYGTMTVDMNGRVYEFAMEHSFWSDFKELLRESKRGGASAGSTWNNVKEGKYGDRFGYDEQTVIELD